MPFPFSFWKAQAGAGGGGTSYLLNEDAEGAGRPTDWANNGGTYNWDDAAVALEGSQSLSGTNGGSEIFTLSATQTTLEAYFMFRTSAAGNGAGQILNFGNVFTRLNYLCLNADRTLTMYSDGGSVTPTYQIPLDTTVHVWVKHIAGTSIEVWVNNSATKPASSGSTNYGIVSAGVSATAIGNVWLGNYEGPAGSTHYFDHIRASAGAIGSNPP